MAKIPVVPIGSTQLSNPRLTTQAPTAAQTQTIGAGQGTEALGNALEKSADTMYRKLDEARNYTEAGQYEAFKAQTMANLKIQSENDTYTDSEGKVWLKTGTASDWQPYKDTLTKAKSEAAKFFTSKEQLVKAMSDWDKSALETESHISATFMKNIGKNGDAITRGKLDLMANAFDGTPASEKAIDYTINQAVANHIYDPGEAYKLKEQTIKEARNKLFINDLNTNPELADERLKSNYYKFDVDVAEKARSHYETQVKLRLEKQRVDNRFDSITAISNGVFDINRADELMRHFAKTDPELAEAIKASASAGSEYFPQAENEAFAGVVKDVFSSGTQEEVSDFLVRALRHNANGEISRDRLAIITSAAIQRAKSLGLSKNWADAVMKDPVQAAIDAGVHSIMKRLDAPADKNQTIADYLNLVKAGTKPKEAYDTAIKNSIIRQYPETVTMDNPPTMVVDKNTPIKYVFAKGKISPSRVWNPKTKQFEPNKNAETRQ